MATASTTAGLGVSVRDGVRPAIGRTREAMRSAGVRLAMGTAARVVVVDNFAKLEGSRANQMGGKRTHFYEKAGRGTQRPQLVGEDGFTISINKEGVAQRYFGGVIRAGRNASRATGRPTKYLAIPAAPMAYGRRPGEFGDRLAFVPAVAGRCAFLAEKKTRRPMYWLKTSVNQKADPTVLPKAEELSDAARGAGGDYIALEFNKGGQP